MWSFPSEGVRIASSPVLLGDVQRGRTGDLEGSRPLSEWIGMWGMSLVGFSDG